MAKVIWLGEDHGDVAGPSFTICYGLKLPKGEPVELSDPDMLRRARGNLFFKVIEEEKPRQEKSHGEGEVEAKSEFKSKAEKKENEYDYRKAEKGSGYSPVKKKVRKRKTPEPSSAARSEQ